MARARFVFCAWWCSMDGMSEDSTQPGTQGDINVGDVISAGHVAIGHGATINVEALPTGVKALHQLPSPVADFTGRAAELDELTQAVATGGAAISGVRGLGGIGKTALALVLANRLKDKYPDAQLFVNLRGASANPMSAAGALAHIIRAWQPTAQLPEDTGQLRAIYLQVLQGQRALLLLDDARDAEQVQPLLPPEGCLLLVTTRQRFALPGLQALDLDSLPEDDATALLLKIAPRIGESAGAMAKLCGYLPLALRLAGSVLAERDDLPVGDYLRRLGDERTRLGLVEGVLQSSLALLDAALQARWAALAVFPADFEVSAAQAIWQFEDEDGTDTAQDTLSELRRYSLLEWSGETNRYRLHDLARVYAAAQQDESAG